MKYRLRQHIADANSAIKDRAKGHYQRNPVFATWIESLYADELRPVIEILGTAEPEHADAVERITVNMFRAAGAPIANKMVPYGPARLKLDQSVHSLIDESAFVLGMTPADLVSSALRQYCHSEIDNLLAASRGNS